MERAASPAAAPAPVARATPTRSTVAVCDDDAQDRAAVCDALETLGYTVAAEANADAIAARCRGDAAPKIVLVASADGAALASSLRAGAGPRPVVIASLDGPAATARDRFLALDADLFALRPHSPESLAPVLHAAVMLHDRQREIRGLRAGDSHSKGELERTGRSDRAGFQQFEFFQRFLITEIKRAKRFGYSLAVVLVSPDDWPGDAPSPATRRQADSELTEAIGACIRDIDLPVDYAGDRRLLFLPYTDLEGARRVGERVARAVVDRGVVEASGEIVRRTVSIGIAALKPGKPVSFARLMRDANAALKAAKLKGGGRVVVRT